MTWVANSGADADLNVDNANVIWSATGYRPLPVYDTVRENYYAEEWPQFKPYHVQSAMMGGLLAVDATNIWNDFIWRADATSTEQATMTIAPYTMVDVHQAYQTVVGGTPRYQSDRSPIFNAGDGNTHNRYTGTPNTQRQNLRVHEDTNYAYPGGQLQVAKKGSEGCIALRPGSMQDYTARCVQKTAGWKTTRTGAVANHIPLYVFASGGGNISEWVHKSFLTITVP